MATETYPGPQEEKQLSELGLQRAFPGSHESDELGISKLGYYAAFILSGLLSRTDIDYVSHPESAAKKAVEHARALIREMHSMKTSGEKNGGNES